jgi:hypothetical protein
MLPAAGAVMLTLAAIGLAVLLVSSTRQPSERQPSGGQVGELAQVINITTALLLGVLWTRVPLHQTTTFDRQAGLARTETRRLWSSRITTTPLHEIVAVVTATDNYRAYARLQLASGSTRPLCSATRLLRFRAGLPASVLARATQAAAWLDVPLHHQT